MRRKSPAMGVNSPSRSDHTRPRAKMQCSTRVLIVVLFLGGYILFTLHLAGLQHSCPTFEELVLQDENKPFVQSIKLIARSVNVSALANDTDLNDINIPLAKLGIEIPMGAPPIVVEDPDFFRNDIPHAQQLPIPHPTSYANELMPQDYLLNGAYAPNNVFYVWCGRRWFEFQHYLSVKSVIREIRPDNIIFFYDTHPVMDSWTYNTWFDELRQEYPFFRLWPLEQKEQACDGFGQVSQTFILNLLTYRGGMYVHENTLVSKFPHWYRNHTLINALDLTTNRGFLMAQKGYPGRNKPLDEVMATPNLNVRMLQCVSINQYIKAHKKPSCVNTEDTFFPKDVWELENSFGRLTRKIFYGVPHILRPKKSYKELIPNIAHIVWLGGGEMDFLFYLCVLSLIYVAEVDQVYIHGDAPPTGIYWQRLKGHEKITNIYRDTPATIYGNKVEIISHVTDVWRVDFMVKYGGIYVDTDTVFVKPLDREIRAYDAVGSYDWTYWNAPFPDTINFGVAIGKRNAKYWHKFQESMKWFMDNDWSWNGLRQPYRIQERHPDLVLVDPRLQVICFEAKCHPTWWPNYHDEKIHHLNTNSIKNWRNDTYAFHWTLPTPDELLNEENLLKSDSIFAEIGQYILRKAGKLQ